MPKSSRKLYRYRSEGIMLVKIIITVLLLIFLFGILEVLVFSSGTVINVPDIPEDSDTDAPFWRNNEDNSSDLIYDYVEGED